MWSPEQDRALQRVADWLDDPGDQQVFRLFGYAGTGKTTLARHFASNIEGQVHFAAYTGKAAHVLRTKGCEGARTIHSLIYLPKGAGTKKIRALEAELDRAGEEDPPDLGLIQKLQNELEQELEAMQRPNFTLNVDSELLGAKLVVIDECSMVGRDMAEDLMSFGVPILVLGDPAQLPPVKSTGYFTDAEPDVMLTEIHRQARDNPILELATRVRQGDRLQPGRYGESQVCERGSRMPPDRLLEAGQLLVGRNNTRAQLNAHCRRLLDLPEFRVSRGDKIVCLRNDREIGLLNGSLWKVDRVESIDDDIADLRIIDDLEGKRLAVPVHTAPFENRRLPYAWFERKRAQEFDFGYALTVHKAQGSQWDDVIIYDESRAFRADASRWLYTAITRAAERVTVVPR